MYDIIYSESELAIAANEMTRNIERLIKCTKECRNILMDLERYGIETSQMSMVLSNY